jgi:hypothetical protein
MHTESCSFWNYDFTAWGGDEVITQSLGLELLGPWLSLGFCFYIWGLRLYVDPWTRVSMLYVKVMFIAYFNMMGLFSFCLYFIVVDEIIQCARVITYRLTISYINSSTQLSVSK